jgi:DNA-directed RNA polymerase specialized sigma subunit
VARMTRQEAQRSRHRARAVQMHDFYMAGHTLRQTAKEYGISFQRVSQLFKKYDLELRDSHGRLPSERPAAQEGSPQA